MRNYDHKNVKVKILACLFYLQQLQKSDEEEQKISMAHCPTHYSAHDNRISRV